MMDIREKHAWHIQNLIEVEPDAQVVILQEVEALQKELDELKASIPKIKADAVRAAMLDNSIFLDRAAWEILEQYANQLEGKE